MTNFSQYKQGYATQLWHKKLNNFIDAVDTEVNSIGDDLSNLYNTVTGWLREEQYLMLITATPTYSNSTTFTLTGDWTAYTEVGSAIVSDCGEDGAFFAEIVSSIHASGTTTVVINREVLTSNLVRVFTVNTRQAYHPSNYPVIYASDFGDPGNDTLDNALAYIGTTDAILVITGGDWELTRGVTIPSNVRLSIVPGSKLVNSITTKSEIEGASKESNVCTITSTSHGLSTGDYIFISGVTQADWLWLNGHWPVSVVDSNSFTIPRGTKSSFDDYVASTDPGVWQKAIVIEGNCVSKSTTTQYFDGPFVLLNETIIDVNNFGKSRAGFQNAIAACPPNRITTVRLNTHYYDPYVIDDTIYLTPYVNIIGTGNPQLLRNSTDCTIQYTGEGPLFYPVWTLENQVFSGFGVDISGNSNATATVLTMEYGTIYCSYDFSIYRGSNTTLGTQLIFQGKTYSGVAMDSLYFNEFRLKVCGDASSKSSGPALLIGTDQTQCRANDNIFYYCYLSGYEEAIRLAGHNNLFLGVNCQQNDVGLHFIIESDGGGTYNNNISSCYFDGFSAGNPCIKVTNNLDSDIYVFTVLGDSTGLLGSESYNISINNTSTGLAFYSVIGRSIVLGGNKDGTYIRDDKTPCIYNPYDDGFIRLYGGPGTGTDSGAGLALCGSLVSSTANSFGPGNALIILNNSIDSAFRVSSTSDGLNFTRNLEITAQGAIRGLRTSNGPVGTFTLKNDGSTTTDVTNTSVTASSKVFLTPTGGNAPTSGAKVTAVTAEVGFTVTHNASPGSGCTFNYLLVN